MRWEDIATVAAVVRSKSFLAAAKELGIRHSSVSRRIAAIEAELGEPLFLRGRRPMPTSLALEFETHAQAMAISARHLEASVAARRARRGGEIVITTNDALVPLLLRGLERIDHATRVRLVVTDDERELEPGAIDVALRPTGAPRRSLRGRKLGTLAVAVYRKRGAKLPPDAWVLPSDEMRGRASLRWLQRIPAQAQAAIVCDRILAMRDACIAGLGRALLPRFLAEGDTRLEEQTTVEDGIPIWLFVATAEAAARFRVFVETLAKALKADKRAWASGERAH